MPLLDTRKKQCDLTRVFICDLVLQILSYVAQTERENLRKRQAEGIALAKAKGKHLGRPPIKKPEKFNKVRKMCERGEITVTAAAKTLGVSRLTYRRWVENS